MNALSWVPPMIVVSDLLVTLAPIRDESMSPALPLGGVAVISRFFTTSWCRGDIVAVTPPNGSSRVVTRRIIALPGDQVIPRNGVEHLKTIPPGYVWLEGDKIAKTCEGLHPLSLLTGRVVWSIPSNSTTTFESKTAHGRVYHRGTY